MTVDVTTTWSTVLEPLIQISSVIIAGAVSLLVKEAVGYLRNKKLLEFSDVQAQKIEAAVNTGAGMLQQKIQAGEMKLADVKVGNGEVAQSVAHVAQSVPAALAYFNTTPETIENKVLSTLAERLGNDPTVPGVAGASSMNLQTTGNTEALVTTSTNKETPK